VHGVLVVDKPAGPTSHDVVDRVRGALGVRRVGHTGTLDPFATGVLPVCVGKATRLVRFLAEGEKAYRATVRLGFATTTDDASGAPRTEPRSVAVSRDGVVAACRGLTGRLSQVPPAFSAKRSGGRRLYEMARAGVEVVAAPVEVVVHRLDVLALEGDRVELDVRCSPGTYVRALARDLGEALGTGGHLEALRRTWTSGFGLDAAVGWDDLGPGIERALVPLDRLLPDVPAVAIGADAERALRHGRDLDRTLAGAAFPDAPAARFRIVDAAGRLLALAVPRGFDTAGGELPARPVLHPDVVLAD
jgi:tRNA pseudouridine55 synthase